MFSSRLPEAIQHHQNFANDSWSPKKPERTSSITWAVAYNVVGPALPQALRVIRYRYESLEDVYSLTCGSVPHAPSTDFCAISQKDRASRTSVLTAEEPRRPRRAAYRIMLYCNIFSANHGDGLDEDGIRHVQRQRTAVLWEYSTDKLLQLYAVVRYFRGILEDTCVGYPNRERLPMDRFQCSSCSCLPESGIVNVLSTLGPDGVKRVWDERAYDSLADEIAKKKLRLPWDEDLDYPLFTGYSSLPLGNIWTMRNAKPPNDEEPASKFILDIFSSGGNDTYWHRAPLYPGHLLKGKFGQTATFQKYLFDVIYTHARDNHDESFGPWIANVFRVPKTTEWEGWTKDKSYCLVWL
ncbi:hypothetical protein C8R45DRAFT_931612 [Mycena sanguinolenta]|nr:hypothetical protein C8R45DRAFT_931612 [Mycena sanguinolenta]